MKPSLHHVPLVALFVLAAGPVVSLVACEGEPPVGYPQNFPGASAEAVPAPEATGNAQPAPAIAESSAPQPPAPAPCASAPATAASATATSASAAPAGSGAVPPAPAPPGSAEPPPVAAPAQEGTLVGSITTKPAGLAAYGAVYLEDGPKEGAPERPPSVTVANRQMAFLPFVAVVPAGSKVVFFNGDPFPHNVFSPDHERFDMGNIAQNSARAKVFNNPGAYSLLCNLHPGMLGYLLVTPSAWFARTDAKGNFSLKHVAPGTYQVTAWAPRQLPLTQTVTVVEGDNTVHFDLHH